MSQARVLAALALALVFAWSAKAGAAETFLTAAVDVPLMGGLTEVEGVGVVFDKPDGRIVEAYAVGSVAAAQVERYYAEVLPHLGWQKVESARYQRESETLRLNIGGRDGALTVRFDITPR
jgi:hypothetical protein